MRGIDAVLHALTLVDCDKLVQALSKLAWDQMVMLSIT